MAIVAGAGVAPQKCKYITGRLMIQDMPKGSKLRIEDNENGQGNQRDCSNEGGLLHPSQWIYRHPSIHTSTQGTESPLEALHTANSDNSSGISYRKRGKGGNESP